MEVFFVSDVHFGHRRIQEFCPHTRVQGVSLEEHDEILIQNWNSRVKPGDIIYNLGDFSFHTVEKTEQILQRLQGEHHIIHGNHGKPTRDNRLAKYFAWRGDYKTIRLDDIKVVMFHYPIHEWEQCHKGAFHLFGHVHSSYTTVGGRSLNVGIDSRPQADMMPWHWDEVKEILNTKEIREHH